MPFEYPYTQSLFRKSGYLHVGEIYTSKTVGLKPHKKYPHTYGYKNEALEWSITLLCI